MKTFVIATFLQCLANVETLFCTTLILPEFSKVAGSWQTFVVIRTLITGYFMKSFAVFLLIQLQYISDTCRSPVKCVVCEPCNVLVSFQEQFRK